MTARESRVSSVIWVPPRKSRPRRGDSVRAKTTEITRMVTASTARTTLPWFTGSLQAGLALSTRGCAKRAYDPAC